MLLLIRVMTQKTLGLELATGLAQYVIQQWIYFDKLRKSENKYM
jgi:hypothetical protein